MDSSASIHIALTPAEVFAFVSDVRNDARWRTGVVEGSYTSDPPHGVGSTGFARAERNGKDLVAEWEVVDWRDDPHARWRLVSGPITGTGGYVCVREGDGTSFTLEADVAPVGFLRVLGPLFGIIGRRQNAADVATLKAILEG